MMLWVLAESALRAFVLGGAVWLGLYLFRVRNPGAHMTAWVMVLLASLSMPLLMHWTTVTLTVQAPPMPLLEALPSGETLLPETLHALPVQEGSVSAAPSHAGAAVNWWLVATAIYVPVAGFMLLRLVLGVHLTWRIVRSARPLREEWTADWDVRVNSDVSGPVTVGSIILVPPDYTEWDATKRQAVLAHESAHVANGDFYLLLLASLNRLLFWFSPFAWWQLARLAELAEIISDDRAIEALSDRVSYAQVLLELVQGPQGKAQGNVQGNVQGKAITLEMARGCTVPTRIEIILAAATLPPRLGWRRRFSIVAMILPFVIVSAGSIAYRTLPAAAHAVEAGSESQLPVHRPQHIAFYAMGPGSSSGAVFAISREDDDLFGQVTGQRRLRLAALKDGTTTYSAAAGEITFSGAYDGQSKELALRQYGHEVRAVRIAELSGETVASNQARFDQYVGWYRLTPSRVLTVTREGGRLLAQDTGRAPVELAASGEEGFIGEAGEIVIFLRDDKGDVNRILFQDPVYGPRLAPRVDASQAKAAETAMAHRALEASSRFAEQTPAPGGREAVLRGIEDIRRGTPNYDRMSGGLAAAIRRQLPELQAMFAAFGAVDQIFFRGVGPGGYDIYGVKFANGSAQFRLSLALDGKVNDVLLHADGNDEPGGVVECGKESGLKPPSDNIPIHMMLLNNTGSDIQIYNLDHTGHRTEHGTIADSRWSTILTSVNSPWLVTDGSGRCLQIVLPGQDTRFHLIEAAGSVAMPARNAPQAGSEDSLREYIIGLGQGQPNYEHMTPELASYTRQQLPYDQAIVRKLGELRALSFRARTRFGMDVYMAHFANGTAEWRIGLSRNGAIARIALGPQY